MIPRIRTHKPETATHELLWLVENITHLPIIRSYMFLWNWTDRRERFEWKPRVLKNGIAPYDAIDFEHVMNALANSGFIVKYVVDGRLYGWVPRFLAHQQINNRESDSLLPPPPPGVIAEYENMRLRGDFHELPPLAELLADPPIFGGKSVSPNRPHDNELATRHARDTPRVHDAPRPELNRTELNRTELNEGTASVESTQNGASTSTGLAHVRDVERSLPAVHGKRTAAALVARLGQVLDEVHDGTRRAIAKTQLRELQAEFVFTYWANVHDHLDTIMDTKRVRRIVTRLDENQGDIGELLYAVDGAKRDKQLMGENDRERKYDGVQTIFRDREIVERLAELVPAYRQKKPHKMLTKWGEMFAQFTKGEAI